MEEEIGAPNNVGVFRHDNRFADGSFVDGSLTKLCIALSVCSSTHIPATIFVKPYFKQLRWNTRGALHVHQEDPSQLPQWPLRVFIPRTFSADQPISFAPHVLGIDTLQNSSPDGFDLCGDIWHLIELRLVQIHLSQSQFVLVVSNGLRNSILNLLRGHERHQMFRSVSDLCSLAILDPFSEPLWQFQHELLRPFCEVDLFSDMLVHQTSILSEPRKFNVNTSRSIYAFCSAAPDSVAWVHDFLDTAISNTPSLRHILETVLQYLRLVIELNDTLLRLMSTTTSDIQDVPLDRLSKCLRLLLVHHVPYGPITVLTYYKSLYCLSESATISDLKTSYAAEIRRLSFEKSPTELERFVKSVLGNEEHPIDEGPFSSMLQHIQSSKDQSLASGSEEISKFFSIVLNKSFYSYQLGSYRNIISELGTVWPFITEKFSPGIQLWLIIGTTLIQAYNATGVEAKAINIVVDTVHGLLSDQFIHQLPELEVASALECFRTLLKVPLSHKSPTAAEHQAEFRAAMVVQGSASRKSADITSRSQQHLSPEESLVCGRCHFRCCDLRHCPFCEHHKCFLGVDSTSREKYEDETSPTSGTTRDRYDKSRYSPKDNTGRVRDQLLRTNLHPLSNFKIMAADSCIGRADYQTSETILYSLLNFDSGPLDDNGFLAAVRLSKVLRRQVTETQGDSGYINVIRSFAATLMTGSSNVTPFALDEVKCLANQIFGLVTDENTTVFSGREDLYLEEKVAESHTTIPPRGSGSEVTKQVSSLIHQIKQSDLWLAKDAPEDVFNADLDEVKSHNITQHNASRGETADRAFTQQLQQGHGVERINADTKSDYDQCRAEIVKFISMNRSLEIRDSEGWTMLLRETYSNHDTMVAALLDRGADIEVKDGYGQTPLHLSAKHGYNIVAKLLLDSGADTEVVDNYGATPLGLSAFNGHDEVTRLLVDKGANIEVKDKHGRTPLHHLAFNGHDEVIRILLDNGANIDIKDEHGKAPLHQSAGRGHDVTTRLLLDSGADIDVQDNNGQTPLHNSAAYGYDVVTRLLLDKGANIEVKDNKGQTPLHLSAAYGSDVVTRLLLDNGANIEIKDNEGATPLHHAAHEGQDSTTMLLLDRGSLIEARSNADETAFSIAAGTGSTETMMLLANRGANINSKKAGRTPLDEAINSGNKSAQKILVRLGAKRSTTSRLVDWF